MSASGSQVTNVQQPPLKTPVAFFIFNRPDTTLRVFEAIRRAAPSTLLVVADGPRPDRPGEADRCAAVREIVSRVDWPCQVLRHFSEANLGCRRRMSSGLDWVFDTVEEAIILEDDCLPEPTFFPFCQELLERYRDDERVMMISGDNFRAEPGRADSYYFSRYPHIWGWATWRRVWERYDTEMKLWPQVRGEGWVENLFPQKRRARFWREAFDAVHSGGLDTWDHQFTFCCLMQDGLCIMPETNLVSNLGFGADATHTKAMCRLAELPTEPMRFPLRHPSRIERDISADRATEKEQHNPIDLLQKLRLLARQITSKFFGGTRCA